MRDFITNYNSILLFGLLTLQFLIEPCTAQDLGWNSEPHLGLVFQINNKEAQKLLSDKIPNYEIEQQGKRI